MLSEPPPLDEVLQAKGQDIESIRAVIHALGQRRSEEESAYFIKMDAWHIHKLPLLRAAFPETPWAFVYRDPLEVLVSQIARPGKHVMQGAMDPDALAMGPFAGAGLSKQEWCARVLAAILQAALACKKDPQALFVNYRDLPDAVFGSLAQHFHLSLSDDDIARMRRVAEFNSKTPGLWFEPDAAAKQAAATTEIKDLCATHLTEIYRQVDA